MKYHTTILTINNAMPIRLPKMNFDPLPSKTAKTHI